MYLLDIGGAAVEGDSEVSYRSGPLRRQSGGALKRLRSCYIGIVDRKQIVGITRRKCGNHSYHGEARQREPPIAQ